jgi:hypothetical protein
MIKNRLDVPFYLNKKYPNGVGVELGSFKGEYASHLTKNWNGTLYMIDIWRPLSEKEYDDATNNKNYINAYSQAMDNIKGYEDKTFMLRMRGKDAVNLFADESLDFIYIDANHTYEAVIEDLTQWYPKIKPGGLIMGHDYLPDYFYKDKEEKNQPLYTFPEGQPEKAQYAGMFGVKPAVDEFVYKHNYCLNKTDEFLGTWYFTKGENKTTKNVVLYCTRNYLQSSLNLINSFKLFNKDLQFNLYTVNFKCDSFVENVNFIPFYNEEIRDNIEFKNNINDSQNPNMLKSVLLKSKIILHSLTELNLNEAIYVDSDILPTQDISSLFAYFKNIDNYPLIQKGIYEYQINFGRGNPFTDNGFDETKILEWPLMEKCHVPSSQRTHYSVASVMIYNQNCLEFIKEYDTINSFAFKMNIEDINYYYPFTDETTINVLLWKYNYLKRLPLLQMNIENIDNVIEYYESNYEYEKIIPDTGGYVRVPSKFDKKNILFFHGAKGILSDQVFSYLKNIKNNINFI